jgi:hypothetical protein
LGDWKASGHPWMPLWGTALLAVTLLVNLVTVVPLWPARLDRGVAEVGFSRQRYASFQEGVARLTGGRRALVLVEPDPADRHIDYVLNSPSLDDRVLIGRYRQGATDAAAIRRLFPMRDIWLVRIATGEISRLSQAP